MSGPECRRSEPDRTPFVSNQTATATYEDDGVFKGYYVAHLQTIYGTKVKIQVKTGGSSSLLNLDQPFHVVASGDCVSTGTVDEDDAMDFFAPFDNVEAGVDTCIEMHIMDVRDNACSVSVIVDRKKSASAIEKEAGLYTACVRVPSCGAYIEVFVSLNGEKMLIDALLCYTAPPVENEVEAIIGRSMVDDEVLYHVRWKGLNRDADSLLCDEQFTEPNLVTDYELRLPAHDRTHRYTEAVMLVEHCTSSELIAEMKAKFPRRAARFAVVIPCGGGKTTIARWVDWMIDFDDLMCSMPSDDDYTNAVHIRNELFSGVHNGRTSHGGKIAQMRRDNFAYFAERGNAALQALPEDDDRCVAVHSVSMAKALGLTILARRRQLAPFLERISISGIYSKVSTCIRGWSFLGIV